MTTVITAKLGPREYQLAPLPWGQLRQLMGSINLVGFAAASGSLDDACMDELAKIVCTGLRITPADFDQIPTDLAEVLHAFNQVIKVSGLEQVMGEALRVGRLAVPPSPQASIPGTASTPT